MLGLLAKHDANMDAAGTDGDTALHVAVRSGEGTMLSWLLSNGASPNLRNGEGDLPSHIAAALGDTAAMDVLIEYGASVRKRNWANLTPIGVARMRGNARMVEFLGQAFVLNKRAGAEGEEEGEDIVGQLVTWQEGFEALHQDWDKVSCVCVWLCA
jgi:ankyrin repeat protein